MATLHVRNVPDELYELLRERAAANDRSIGAETVQLLQERLALTGYGRPARRFPGRRRGGGPGLFTRFLPEARDVVVEAQERARALGHDHVGTEHLLLGVLARGKGTPLVRGVRGLGLTLERVEGELEPSPGGSAPQGQIPFEPGAKHALELALREALTLRDDAIAPAHLLLGIVGQETDRGAEILRAIEPDPDALRQCILRARSPLSTMHYAPRFTPEPSFRVLLLDGDAEAWEAQLNDAASLGYELIEIVDRRAVMRRA